MVGLGPQERKELGLAGYTVRDLRYNHNIYTLPGLFPISISHIGYQYIDTFLNISILFFLLSLSTWKFWEISILIKFCVNKDLACQTPLQII